MLVMSLAGMLYRKVPSGTGLRRRWEDVARVSGVEMLRQREASEGFGGGPDLWPGCVLKPVSMDPRGLPGPDSRLWVDESPPPHRRLLCRTGRNEDVPWETVKTQGFTRTLEVIRGRPHLFPVLQFPQHQREEEKGAHSLESPRVAEVRFVVGAGTLVHPFSSTQLAQFGEVRLIRTGDAAAREELGRCCSIQTHGLQGMSWWGLWVVCVCV